MVGFDSLNTNVWTINADSGGNLQNSSGTNIRFSETEHVTGGSENDDFIIAAEGVIGTIDGGEGGNSLTGRDAASTWAIATTGNTITESGIGGDVYVSGFTNIDTLNGGSAVDTFDISSDFAGTIEGGLSLVGDVFNFMAALGGTIYSGIINAGAGDDRFNIDGTNITFSNANALNGGAGSDTLMAANEANFWSVTSADSGAIYADSDLIPAPRVAFNSVEHLEGGTAADT